MVLRGFAVWGGFPFCGLLDCAYEIDLLAIGRADCPKKPFVDEAVSATLGVVARLLC